MEPLQLPGGLPVHCRSERGLSRTVSQAALLDGPILCTHLQLQPCFAGNFADSLPGCVEVVNELRRYPGDKWRIRCGADLAVPGRAPGALDLVFCMCFVKRDPVASATGIAALFDIRVSEEAIHSLTIAEGKTRSGRCSVGTGEPDRGGRECAFVLLTAARDRQQQDRLLLRPQVVANPRLEHQQLLLPQLKGLAAHRNEHIAT